MVALLPQTWMGEGGFDRQKFNLQIGFLIRHLPNKNDQNKILDAWGKKIDILELGGFEPGEITAFSGMEVVTELMQFIYSAFELINIDVDGPATSKQFRDAMIEIPDMDVPVHPEPDASVDNL